MPGTAFSAANWSGYDSASWTPASSVTDFSILIDVSTLSASWKAAVQSDGADIRVTKPDGTTELAYDLIDWAYNEGAPTGLIRAQYTGASGTSALAPRVYAGYTLGTAIAYGVSEPYGQYNAYDSSWIDYRPDGGQTDRTSGRTGTAGGSVTVGGATGKILSATTYDGTDDYVSIADEAALEPSGALTVSMWLKSNQTGNKVIWEKDANVLSMQRAPGDEQLKMNVGGAGAEIGSDADAASGLWDNSWFHGAIIFDGSTSGKAYIDGVDDTRATPNPMSPTFSTGPVYIGSRGGSYGFAGDLCEIAYHDGERAAAWIAEERAQVNSQSTFWGTWAWTTAADTSHPWGIHRPAFHTHLRR